MGAGAFAGVGDPAALSRQRAALWPSVGFGLIGVPTGLALGHGLGPVSASDRGPSA